LKIISVHFYLYNTVDLFQSICHTPHSSTWKLVQSSNIFNVKVYEEFIWSWPLMTKIKRPGTVCSKLKKKTIKLFWRRTNNFEWQWWQFWWTRRNCLQKRC
jgi:hypothetical protein